MAAVQKRPDEEAGFIELVGGLAEDLALLTKQEAELARKELAESTRAFFVRLCVLALGALITLYGVFFLFFSAVFGIGTVLPTWASSLIIGGGLAGLGLILILLSFVALARLKSLPRTARTVRENEEWLKRLKARFWK